MQLKVTKRELTGSKVKHLRREGQLPASVYGPEIKPVNVVMSTKDFKNLFKQAGYSNLFELTIDEDKPVRALVKEVQYDPVKEEFLHVSIYQVNMKKEITAEIPLHFIGESPAVKNNIGLLVTPTDAVDVKCLPANLPSFIEIDISKLENIGDAIQVADIKLPEGVEWDSQTAADTMIAYISAPQKEIVVEEVPAETAEGEEVAAAEGVEGEAKADGAEAEGVKKEEKKEEKK